METDKERTEKERALEMAISQIEKQYGIGSIMSLGERSAKVKVDVIPTGSLSLDLALGIGGIPRGRVTEIFGAEASGKTTLALNIIANAQRQGGRVLYIDAEHALDTNYASICGVNINAMKGAQPGTGEEALDIAERMVRTHALDVIVIDSVAALVPRAEIEGEMGESHVGLQARLMSQALRKLTGEISKSNTAVVFINQLREKVGIIFGSPEVTPGGRALKFYSSVRIDLRKADAIKNGAEIVGNRIRAKVVKNKMAPPYRVAEFDILFNCGISKEGDIIDLGVSTGIIRKSGAFFDFNGTKLGQGKEKVREYLIQHPEVVAEIEKQIRAIALTPEFVGSANKADAECN